MVKLPLGGQYGSGPRGYFQYKHCALYSNIYGIGAFYHVDFLMWLLGFKFQDCGLSVIRHK